MFFAAGCGTGVEAARKAATEVLGVAQNEEGERREELAGGTVCPTQAELGWGIRIGGGYWVRDLLRAGSNSSPGRQEMVAGAVMACQPSSMPKRASLALEVKSMSGV